jgi:hypothetical protein
MAARGRVLSLKMMLDGLRLGQDIGAAWLVVGKNGD